jgi:hypothetical protein
VYGASFLILSHVASSKRKVTTRGFRIIRSPCFREAVAPGTGYRRLKTVRQIGCIIYGRLWAPCVGWVAPYGFGVPSG